MASAGYYINIKTGSYWLEAKFWDCACGFCGRLSGKLPWVWPSDQPSSFAYVTASSKQYNLLGFLY